MMMKQLIVLTFCLIFGLTFIPTLSRAEAEWVTFVQNESRICASVIVDFDPCGQWCEPGPNWTKMGCPENFTMVDASPPGVICKTVNCGPPDERKTERSWSEALNHKMQNLFIDFIDLIDSVLSRLGLE